MGYRVKEIGPTYGSVLKGARSVRDLRAAAVAESLELSEAYYRKLETLKSGESVTRPVRERLSTLYSNPIWLSDHPERLILELATQPGELFTEVRGLSAEINKLSECSSREARATTKALVDIKKLVAKLESDSDREFRGLKRHQTGIDQNLVLEKLKRDELAGEVAAIRRSLDEFITSISEQNYRNVIDYGWVKKCVATLQERIEDHWNANEYYPDWVKSPTEWRKKMGTCTETSPDERVELFELCRSHNLEPQSLKEIVQKKLYIRNGKGDLELISEHAKNAKLGWFTVFTHAVSCSIVLAALTVQKKWWINGVPSLEESTAMFIVLFFCGAVAFTFQKTIVSPAYMAYRASKGRTPREGIKGVLDRLRLA